MSYPTKKKFNGKIYEFYRTTNGYGIYDAQADAQKLRNSGTFSGVRIVYKRNRMPALYVRK